MGLRGTLARFLECPDFNVDESSFGDALRMRVGPALRTDSHPQPTSIPIFGGIDVQAGREGAPPDPNTTIPPKMGSQWARCEAWSIR